jgi:hypothetical protein
MIAMGKSKLPLENSNFPEYKILALLTRSRRISPKERIANLETTNGLGEIGITKIGKRNTMAISRYFSIFDIKFSISSYNYILVDYGLSSPLLMV